MAKYPYIEFLKKFLPKDYEEYLAKEKQKPKVIKY